jgi:hypothetical protein
VGFESMKVWEYGSMEYGSMGVWEYGSMGDKIEEQIIINSV